MNIGGKLIGGLLVAGAAMAGSYVGEGLRSESETTGESPSMAMSEQDLDLPRLFSSALPAMALGLIIGRPRMLFAFIGGLLISLFLGGRGPLQETLSDLSVGRAGSKV